LIKNFATIYAQTAQQINVGQYNNACLFHVQVLNLYEKIGFFKSGSVLKSKNPTTFSLILSGIL